MSRYNLIQFRVSDDEKAAVRRGAEAAGKTLTKYARDLVLASLGGGTVIPMPERKGQAGGSDSSIAKNEGAKAEPAAKVPPVVAAEVAEARLEDNEAREAFIGRRTREHHGHGHTTPVARQMAVRDWEQR